MALCCFQLVLLLVMVGFIIHGCHHTTQRLALFTEQAAAVGAAERGSLSRFLRNHANGEHSSAWDMSLEQDRDETRLGIGRRHAPGCLPLEQLLQFFPTPRCMPTANAKDPCRLQGT